MWGVAVAKALAEPPVARRVVPAAGAAGRDRRALHGGGCRRARVLGRVAARVGGGDAEVVPVSDDAVAARDAQARADAGRLPAPSRRRPETSSRVSTLRVRGRDDLRPCEPEGRRRQDHDRRQPRRLPRRGRASGCSSSTSTRRRTPRRGSALERSEPSTADLLDGAPLDSVVRTRAFANLDAVPASPDLAGSAAELGRRDASERYLRRRARAGARALRVHLRRLPAVARPADRQRARRRRPRARARPGRVLRDGGAGAAAADDQRPARAGSIRASRSPASS